MGINLNINEESDLSKIDTISEMCLYHSLYSSELNVVSKLINLNVSKEVIQQIISDDISNINNDELKSAIETLATRLDDKFISIVSTEGFWTSLKYAFTKDTKVQKIIEDAGNRVKKFDNNEWNTFLDKKVTTTCFLRKQAEAMLEALSSITRGLIDYFNLIHRYGWIYQPDDVERVKQYDPMQYKAMIAQLKPVVEKGDAIYAKLTKKGTYDAALTGRYQPVKSASLSKLGFDKASTIALLNKHAHDSAGCKSIIGSLMNMCANYGNDVETSSSVKVETSYNDDGTTDTSVKNIKEIKAIAKQSFIQITKLAQLAVTVYTPLDKFIYAIAKNVK